MATSINVIRRSKLLNRYFVIANVTMGNSYPTGGEAIDPQKLGLTTVEFLLAAPAGGYVFEFDHTNKKLKAFNPTAPHAHTENLADAYTQNATTAQSSAVPASEVPNATDLSAVTTRVMAVGL